MICSGFAVALMAATQLAAETVTIKVATYRARVSPVIKPGWMRWPRMRAQMSKCRRSGEVHSVKVRSNSTSSSSRHRRCHLGFLATRLGNFPSYRSWNCRSSQKAVMLLPWRVGTYEKGLLTGFRYAFGRFVCVLTQYIVHAISNLRFGFTEIQKNAQRRSGTRCVGETCGSCTADDEFN